MYRAQACRTKGEPRAAQPTGKTLDSLLGTFTVEHLLALIILFGRSGHFSEDPDKPFHVTVVETASLHLVQKRTHHKVLRFVFVVVMHCG